MTNYNDIDLSARVWVYQSDRLFTDYEAISIKGKIQHFVKQWVAHAEKVKGFGDLYFNRFVVLFADEEEVGVSGCSIDSSVNFIKTLGATYGVDFFDRFNIAFRVGNEIKSLSKVEFEKALAKGIANKDTVVFNNLVASKSEFERSWQLPLKDSWHARVFQTG